MSDIKEKAQALIDAIQRDEKNDDGSFLIGEGDKPDYFDKFIELTLHDFNATVNGCIKARNNPKKKDDLKKYKEGYINEIIQNANDVAWLTEVKNPVVEVCVERKDNKYTVECSYPDNGFTLENIYGFCTRGNSDKNGKNGQEGMYGIGIKSLFCFVDDFSIESNVSITVSSSERLLDTHSIKINDSFDKTTILKFSFTYDRIEPENNKHAGFNVKKLADFIDAALEEDNANYERWFLSGKDDELVFDVRGLFFTDLRGDRRPDNSIKTIKIYRKKEEVREEILEMSSVEEPLLEATTGNPAQCRVKKVCVDIGGNTSEKYLLFHFPGDQTEDQISIALKYDQEEGVVDRLYSTYYIGGYGDKSFLGVKTGCLINTTAINSSRSGLERESEKEPEVLSKIMEMGRKVVSVLCENSNSNKDFQNVLCNLLYMFRFKAEKSEEGWHPQYIFDGELQRIEACMGEWDLGAGYRYVLKEEDGIDCNNKTVNKNCPPNSNDVNKRGLYDFYVNRIKRNNEVIINGSEDYKNLGSGILRLCEFFFGKDDSWIKQIQSIPFLNGIKELLVKRIGGYDFNRVTDFIQPLDKENRLLAKQLIARYEVNDCFDLMGNYSKGNIKNWLFGKKVKDDPDYEEAMKEYEESYGELKNYVSGRIVSTNYYHSYHWKAYSYWWWKYPENGFPSDSEDQGDSDKLILTMLKLMSDQIINVGMYKYSEDVFFVGEGEYFGEGRKFFAHNLKEPNVVLYNRQRKTRYWNGEISLVNLKFLMTEMKDFDSFKAAREYLDKYNSYDDRFRLYSNYINSCHIKEISLKRVNRIFEWLAEYDLKKMIGGSDEVKSDAVANTIRIDRLSDESANDSDSEVIRFAKFFVGDDVYIRNEVITVKNNRRHFIGYMSNIPSRKSGLFIRNSAGTEKFIQVGTVDPNNRKFILIFSTYNDESGVLADVSRDILGEGEGCSYIKNFIRTGNVINLPPNMFNRYIKKRKIDYRYPFEYEEIEAGEDLNDLNMNDIYEVLKSEMSYDDHCPICNQIPTLNIKGDANYSLLEKRNSLIAMLSAKYKGESIYVKIPCCKNCFEEYKHSLTDAEIEDVDDKKYKKLKLKSRIVTSNRERDMVNEIKLSPDNWEIINAFRKVNNA